MMSAHLVAPTLHVLLVDLSFLGVGLLSAATLVSFRASGSRTALALGTGLLGFGALYFWHGLFTHAEHTFAFAVYGGIARLVLAVALFGLVDSRPPVALNARRRALGRAFGLVLVLAATGGVLHGWLDAFEQVQPEATLDVYRRASDVVALLVYFAAAARLARRRAQPRNGVVLGGVGLCASASALFLVAPAWSTTWWASHVVGAAGTVLLTLGVVRPGWPRALLRPRRYAARVGLRGRITISLVALLCLGDGLAAWAVSDRLEDGGRRQAELQAHASAAQTRAVYEERIARLTAEAEAAALYPAVIAAVAERNAAPLERWSSDVADLQSQFVAVFGADGVPIVGEGPANIRSSVVAGLSGLRRALAGDSGGGLERDDALGLAVRGYAPVRRAGRSGPVVGAVMLAQPLDDRLLQWFTGGQPGVTMRVEPPMGAIADVCAVADDGASATCRLGMTSVDGTPAATVRIELPFDELRRAHDAAQRNLVAIGSLVLLGGLAMAWRVARSLTRPVALLTTAARRIAYGDYDGAAVAFDSTDELGALARAFETMRVRVAETTAALRKERDVLNAVLESTGDGVLL